MFQFLSTLQMRAGSIKLTLRGIESYFFNSKLVRMGPADILTSYAEGV